MGHQGTAFTEFQKIRQDLINLWSRKHHAVVDTGQLLDPEWDRNIRVDKGAELVRDRSIYHLYRTDLDDPIGKRTKSGGLDIKHHVRIVKALISGILHQLLGIIYQITLHAIDHLERIILVQAVAGLGKCLDTAVIRHCQRRHSPFLGAFDDIRHIRNTIHIAHLRMAVELNPLYQAVIIALARKILTFLDAYYRSDGQLTVKLIDGGHPPQFNEILLHYCLVDIL